MASFLRGRYSPTEYLLHLDSAGYCGFNLVVGDLSTGEIAYFTNCDDDMPVKLPSGTYGISNGTLTSAWPKVFTGKAALQVPPFYLCVLESLATLFLALVCC